MIEIRELTKESFKDFISLLSKRGRVITSFYEWKYINTTAPLIASGYVAYKDNLPLGCIGKLNKNIVDQKGKIVSATWFADWYILEQSRGTGAGKALMQQVAASAKVGMGIPGPLHAQAVAAKAGYQSLHGFVEVRIPLNPWRVGLKKYKGPLIMRSLRGLNEMMIAAKWPHVKKVSVDLRKGFPPVDKWLAAIEQGLNKKIHFQRTREFLSWFSAMPFEENMVREWWYYESAEMFVTGFTDANTSGLRRSKVMELITYGNDIVACINQIVGILNSSAVDLVILLLPQFTATALKIPRQWLLPIPLHITLGAKILPEYLSLIDKESSWIDFSLG
ncbi:MAG: GNAT family N-acetyltransferase [Ferruginibacter sp.]